MLYLLYLRVSELVASDRHTPTMGDFFQDSQQQWWFKTVSKGNKAREIAVSNSLLAALKRYRKKGLKLSPSLPTANEATPLLINERTGTPISSTRTVRLLVQTCFDRACEALKQEGFDDDASQLATATVHWLRHTGISDDINQYNRPIAHVRDDAGHSSSAITDLYNDADMKARHASARRK
jgi:integrase